MDDWNEIEQIYRSSYGRLYVFAMSKLRSHELAEEAVQETFRVACSRREEFSAVANKAGWLVGVLKRVMMEIQRHRARDMDLMAAIAGASAEKLLTYDQVKVETLYAREMQDEDFRMLVRFSVYGESVASIAAGSGISIPAARKRLERTRKKYRKKLR